MCKCNDTITNHFLLKSFKTEFGNQTTDKLINFKTRTNL